MSTYAPLILAFVGMMNLICCPCGMALRDKRRGRATEFDFDTFFKATENGGIIAMIFGGLFVFIGIAIWALLLGLPYLCVQLVAFGFATITHRLPARPAQEA